MSQSVRFLEKWKARRRSAPGRLDVIPAVESHELGNRRDISVFFDIYNMFNANPAQNLQWSSGTAYNRPLSVVPPRLARLGLKLNF